MILMDKNEIIERLEEIAKHAVHTIGEEPFIMSLDDGIAIHEAIDIIQQSRSQRIGRWIRTDNESFKQCSECGRHVYAYKYPSKVYPYCHCGAKMEDEG